MVAVRQTSGSNPNAVTLSDFVQAMKESPVGDSVEVIGNALKTPFRWASDLGAQANAALDGTLLNWLQTQRPTDFLPNLPSSWTNGAPQAPQNPISGMAQSYLNSIGAGFGSDVSVDPVRFLEYAHNYPVDAFLLARGAMSMGGKALDSLDSAVARGVGAMDEVWGPSVGVGPSGSYRKPINITDADQYLKQYTVEEGRIGFWRDKAGGDLRNPVSGKFDDMRDNTGWSDVRLPETFDAQGNPIRNPDPRALRREFVPIEGVHFENIGPERSGLPSSVLTPPGGKKIDPAGYERYLASRYREGEFQAGQGVSAADSQSVAIFEKIQELLLARSNNTRITLLAPSANKGYAEAIRSVIENLDSPRSAQPVAPPQWPYMENGQFPDGTQNLGRMGRSPYDNPTPLEADVGEFAPNIPEGANASLQQFLDDVYGDELDTLEGLGGATAGMLKYDMTDADWSHFISEASRKLSQAEFARLMAVIKENHWSNQNGGLESVFLRQEPSQFVVNPDADYWLKMLEQMTSKFDLN